MDTIRRKNAQKVAVAMSPKESLRLPTGQAGGLRGREKVAIAMSGGVDSSVAAALLKRTGFEVIGVFMRFWPSSSLAEKRARKVAKILKIPFHSLNMEKEFKKEIVDYFLSEYKKGKTPNPCTLCNREIKFGLLFKKIKALGADFLATGHYARIKQKGDEFHLLKGRDGSRDQSYFLWGLNQKQLKRTIFPIGNFKKTEVRTLAKKFKLPLLSVPESREICFVKTTVKDFLKKYLKERPGEIRQEQGGVLGKHKGLWFYTIGQRKGINLAGGPYYVFKKDPKKNILVITKKESQLNKKELLARQINWVSGKKPKFPLKIRARIRYRQKESQALLKGAGRGKVKVLFKKAQKAITPGQSIAFYRDWELSGGGVIC